MYPYLEKRKCYADPDICTVISACTNKAISYVKDDDEPIGGRIEFDYKKCSGCGTCASVCCGYAIEMK